MGHRGRTPPSGGHRDIAEALREDIEAGRIEEGAELPTGKALAEEWGVAPGTALQALRLLATEGWATPRPRRAAIARRPPERTVVVRDRHVYRDQLGYFFDQNAKSWRAVGEPSRGLGVPPGHVADLLGVPRGQDVIVRDRGMGPAGAAVAEQLATSYITLALADAIPALRAADTGPGGIYDRIEGHFEVPIEWRETISARPASEVERERLRLPAGAPVLVVTRASTVRPDGGREVVAEVNETRMPAERFAVAYTVERDASARRPVKNRKE
ncbi:GntR family transcriptional regulator [Streptomyces sp. ST2-7A]|uniref:GntR family transcriptional regulator n=1 Tax=Streptomyces sp. ST2-7A TaxID=2907214 RepID=UPI001F2B52B2|nr:GntR family transcriptional regulator [Streptomyces sp. ST2-7A]MCE7081194.1 GntR family transcriptional regulator [Streptomyces sp. ST2-7A]